MQKALIKSLSYQFYQKQRGLKVLIEYKNRVSANGEDKPRLVSLESKIQEYARLIAEIKKELHTRTGFCRPQPYKPWPL